MCDTANEKVFEAEVWGNKHVSGNYHEIRVEFPKGMVDPLPGQFFMLYEPDTKRQLGRPISIHFLEELPDKALNFYYEVKNEGTRALSKLKNFDKLQIKGPLGNGFDVDHVGKNPVLVGGGMGIAPLYYLNNYFKRAAEKDPHFIIGGKSKDVVDNFSIDADDIYTDDGSYRKQGTAVDGLREYLAENECDIIYTCGPAPMMQAVIELAKEHNIDCQISVEARMACGTGDCVGCSFETIQGRKRVCKEGPVFSGDDIIKVPELRAEEIVCNIGGKPNPETCLRTNLLGMDLEIPILNASGCLALDDEYHPRLGAHVTKGITLLARDGNPQPRIAETPAGMINSIGLENPGVMAFKKHYLPKIAEHYPNIIANINGTSIEEYVGMIEALKECPEISAYEVNISCPNVKKGGMSFGTDPVMAADVTRACRNATQKPLIVKLTPNVTNIAKIAVTVEQAGADAISMVNTFAAMRFDHDTMKPLLGNKMGGLSGEAIFPIALYMLYQVREVVKVPIIFMGGITCTEHALEAFMAGANAIAIGAGLLKDKDLPYRIANGLIDFCQERGISHLSAIYNVSQR